MLKLLVPAHGLGVLAVLDLHPRRPAIHEPVGCLLELGDDAFEVARSRLLERGVEVGEIRHKTPIGAWDGGFAPGLDPARADYASFADFSDPDGNSWVLQERGYRNV